MTPKHVRIVLTSLCLPLLIAVMPAIVAPASNAATGHESVPEVAPAW